MNNQIYTGRYRIDTSYPLAQELTGSWWFDGESDLEVQPSSTWLYVNKTGLLVAELKSIVESVFAKKGKKVNVVVIEE